MNRVRRLGQDLIPRKAGTPQGPGASFPNSGQPVTWLASCVRSRTAIATSPVPGPLCSDACLVYGHLPGQPPTLATGVPRQEEATCCHYTPPQRRGCQALAHVRRPVLRHCGRVDWEVHSGLSQPCVSSLCRVAQVEVYLVRGLGPTHSLLGPLLSTIPEINYPCACGRFISLENSG